MDTTVQWEPSTIAREQSRMASYMRWLAREGIVDAPTYDALWQWSVDHLDVFWGSIWDHFGVGNHSRGAVALAHERMPGARWFPGTTVNYAAEALSGPQHGPAVLHRSEDGSGTELTRPELRDKVASVAAELRNLGVREGDRVAGVLPNVPEALVAFLASASVGAVWTACPPEFGPTSIVDRLLQVEPVVLFASEQYRYRGRTHDRRDVIAEVRQRLPSLRATVRVPYEGVTPRPHADDLLDLAWEDLRSPATFSPLDVDFEHPLWVVYSSGTTGPPKPIVHSHGGIILEHLKWLGLHTDLGPGDRFFWFTTTGWIMWNAVAGSLLTGAAAVLYDGDPGYPDTRRLWEVAADTQVTLFGASPPFYSACRDQGVVPHDVADLSAIRALGSTGAPLTPDLSRWLQQAVHEDVHVGSASGGTDVATAFVGPCPLLPVRPGRIQCRLLGAKVEAFDPEGQAVVDEVGELVVTRPMPSMPLRLLNDPDGSRYHDSYFSHFPGVWRHGDWIRIGPDGDCELTGRSDATLKRGGVRMGTSEFYAVLDAVPGVVDSLVVDVPVDGTTSELILLVVLDQDVSLDEARSSIKAALREELSPRHVPDHMYTVSNIPRTLNGKKLEVPTKRLFAGVPADEAVSAAALDNPAALDELTTIVARHGPHKQDTS